MGAEICKAGNLCGASDGQGTVEFNPLSRQEKYAVHGVEAEMLNATQTRNDVDAASLLPLRPSKPMQGCRQGLPIVCKGDPSKYYNSTEYIWELLEQKVVVLIKGSWLIERSKAVPFEPLPCRQHLPLEAIVDIEQLRELEASLLLDKQKSGTRAKLRRVRNSIVAISHCWLNPNHPDPDGNLLKELAIVCEAYKNSLHCDQYGFGGAFFFAWCSLWQPFHVKRADGQYTRLKTSQCTPEQLESWSLALENMDIWYTHQQTETWRLTKFFDGQGYPYEDRGWTTWEHTVSELLSDPNAVLDLGKLSDVGAATTIAPSMREICEACIVSRSPPLLPADFVTLIDSKHFTCGDTDKNMIKANYTRNFDHVMSCTTHLRCDGLSWDLHQIFALCKVLPHYRNLKTISLGSNRLGDHGAAAIAKNLYNCTQLEKIGVAENEIGDVGAIALANALRHRGQLVFVNISRNLIGDSGMKAFGDVFGHCAQMRQLWLFENQVGDDGTIALAHALRDCGQLELLTLNYNQFGDRGAIALAEALSNHDKLVEFTIAGNQVTDAGAIVLAEAVPRWGQLRTFWLGETAIGNAGTVALANAFRRCRELRRLCLWQAQIGNVGAIALAGTLAHCDQLEELDLFGNQIGDHGAIVLAEALSQCDKLRQLRFGKNATSDVGTTALVNSLGHGILSLV